MLAHCIAHGMTTVPPPSGLQRREGHGVGGCVGVRVGRDGGAVILARGENGVGEAHDELRGGCRHLPLQVIDKTAIHKTRKRYEE